MADDGDIRGLDYPHTGLLRSRFVDAEGGFPDHWWAVRGRKIRSGDMDPRDERGHGEGYYARRSLEDGNVVVTWSNVGMSGFYAGPRVTIAAGKSSKTD